jgi:hypothetical protein
VQGCLFGLEWGGGGREEKEKEEEVRGNKEGRGEEGEREEGGRREQGGKKREEGVDREGKRRKKKIPGFHHNIVDHIFYNLATRLIQKKPAREFLQRACLLPSYFLLSLSFPSLPFLSLLPGPPRKN